MSTRFKVIRIIADHFKTLRSLNQTYDFMNFYDFMIFILFPSLTAITLTLNNYTFKQHLSDLIATISILGGFLFNLLVVIYSQIENIKNDLTTTTNEEENYNIGIKNKFINEIHINISFAILLSIFLLISLLSTSIDVPDILPQKFIELSLIFINYFLMILFTLTLLMIIGRIYILFKKESNQ